MEEFEEITEDWQKDLSKWKSRRKSHSSAYQSLDSLDLFDGIPTEIKSNSSDTFCNPSRSASTDVIFKKTYRDEQEENNNLNQIINNQSNNNHSAYAKNQYKTIKIRQISNSKKGFGFSLTNLPGLNKKVFVDKIERGSSADINELKIGDEILKINSIDLKDLDDLSIDKIFQESVKSGRIEIYVKRPIGKVNHDGASSDEEISNTSNQRIYLHSESIQSSLRSTPPPPPFVDSEEIISTPPPLPSAPPPSLHLSSSSSIYSPIFSSSLPSSSVVLPPASNALSVSHVSPKNHLDEFSLPPVSSQQGLVRDAGLLDDDVNGVRDDGVLDAVNGILGEDAVNGVHDDDDDAAMVKREKESQLLKRMRYFGIAPEKSEEFRAIKEVEQRGSIQISDTQQPFGPTRHTFLSSSSDGVENVFSDRQESLFPDSLKKMADKYHEKVKDKTNKFPSSSELIASTTISEDGANNEIISEIERKYREKEEQMRIELEQERRLRRDKEEELAQKEDMLRNRMQNEYLEKEKRFQEKSSFELLANLEKQKILEEQMESERKKRLSLEAELVKSKNLQKTTILPKSDSKDASIYKDTLHTNLSSNESVNNVYIKPTTTEAQNSTYKNPNSYSKSVPQVNPKTSNESIVHSNVYIKPTITETQNVTYKNPNSYSISVPYVKPVSSNASNDYSNVYITPTTTESQNSTYKNLNSYSTSVPYVKPVSSEASNVYSKLSRSILLDAGLEADRVTEKAILLNRPADGLSGPTLAHNPTASAYYSRSVDLSPAPIPRSPRELSVNPAAEQLSSKLNSFTNINYLLYGEGDAANGVNDTPRTGVALPANNMILPASVTASNKSLESSTSEHLFNQHRHLDNIPNRYSSSDRLYNNPIPSNHSAYRPNPSNQPSNQPNSSNRHNSADYMPTKQNVSEHWVVQEAKRLRQEQKDNQPVSSSRADAAPLPRPSQHYEATQPIRTNSMYLDTVPTAQRPQNNAAFHVRGGSVPQSGSVNVYPAPALSSIEPKYRNNSYTGNLSQSYSNDANPNKRYSIFTPENSSGIIPNLNMPKQIIDSAGDFAANYNNYKANVGQSAANTSLVNTRIMVDRFGNDAGSTSGNFNNSNIESIFNFQNNQTPREQAGQQNQSSIYTRMDSKKNTYI